MYTAKIIETTDNGKGYWKYLKIGVFENDKQIGEYKRNYSCFFDTFFPFKIGEDWFALYSEDYTATSVMSLPDCKKIATEQPDAFGFCPVEFFVPRKEFCTITRENLPDLHFWDYDISEDNKDDFVYDIKNSFVAGCVWGDDSSWKIQSLDLSEVKQGIIKRTDKFGYIVKPYKSSLSDCICIPEYSYEDGEEDKGPYCIKISVVKTFGVDGKEY